MRVTVLGTNSNDKGHQLEALVAHLLRAQGYSDIVTRQIGPGGHEIDVIAKHEQPILAGRKTATLVCECKAHRQPVGMTDWLKFIGKLQVERQTRSEPVTGCMIALHGLRGTAYGTYESLRQTKEDVLVISGDDLAQLVAETYGMISMEDAFSFASDVTGVRHHSIDIAYYDNRCYWLVSFPNGYFSLVDGADPFQDVDDEIYLCTAEETGLEILHMTENAQAFFFRQFIMQSVVGAITMKEGRATLEELCKIIDECLIHDFKGKTFDFVSLGVVDLERHGVVIMQGEKIELTAKNDSRTEISRQTLELLLGEPIMYPALLRKLYGELVERVVPSVLKEAGNFRISDSERNQVIAVAKLSPGAMQTLLADDPFRREVKEDVDLLSAGISRQQLDELHTLRFRMVYKNMLRALVNDFHSPSLAPYFAYGHRAEELRTKVTLSLKSPAGTLIEGEYMDRVAHMQVGENSSEFVVVALPEELPSLWDAKGVAFVKGVYVGEEFQEPPWSAESVESGDKDKTSE